jgi:hypothetical protein
MRAKEMKDLLEPSTFTESLEIGRIIESVREEGKGPVKAVFQFLLRLVL